MADLYVMAPTGRDVRRLTRTRLSEDGPAWSVDRRTIAFRVSEMTCHAGACDVVLWSGISVVSAAGGTPRRLTGGPELDQFDASPSWSPDSRIAFTRTSAGGGSREGVWVVDVERRSRRLVAGRALAVDWSPDGTRLVYVLEISTLTGTNRVRIVDLRTGRGRTLRARGLPGIKLGAAWAPDGRDLAVEIVADLCRASGRNGPAADHERRALVLLTGLALATKTRERRARVLASRMEAEERGYGAARGPIQTRR